MKKSSILLLSLIALCYLTRGVTTFQPSPEDNAVKMMENLATSLTEEEMTVQEKVESKDIGKMDHSEVHVDANRLLLEKEEYERGFINTIGDGDNVDTIVGCFYDKVSNMITRLQKIVAAYTKICNLPQNKDLKSLFQAAGVVSRIYAVKSVSPSALSPEILALTSQLKSYASEFNNKIFRDLADAINKKQSFDEIVESALKSIEDILDKIISKKRKPVFLRNNVMNLIKAQVAIDGLETFDKEKCIPGDWDGIKSREILRIVNEDGFKNDEISIFQKTDITCKTEVDHIHIKPPQFNRGGIALTWWDKTNKFEFKGKKKVILRGFKDNREVLRYSLIPGIKVIIHELEVANKKYFFADDAKCVDYYFVLLAIQKDCDKYKFISTVKFLQPNVRKHISFDIEADRLENIEFKFESKVITNEFYVNFKYAESKEIGLMSVGVNQNSFYADIKKHSVCKKDCEYSNGKECIRCFPPHVVHNGKCVKKCPDGTYRSIKATCVQCHIKCKICVTNANAHNLNCDKCKDKLYKDNGVCVESCPPNKAPNSDKICVPCGENCEKCQDTKTCVKCKGNTFLQHGKCVKHCDKGSYKSYTPNICVKCRKGCEVCENSKSCIFPPTPWHCKEGYYKNTVDKKCVKCKKHCKVCKDSVTCEKCFSGFKKTENGDCVCHCPKGFIDVEGTCVECEKGCDRCKPSNIDECIKCRKGLVLFHKKCHQKCGDGYRERDGECVECGAKHCKTCTENSCIECKDNYILFENKKCVEKCPNGWIKIGRKCVKCSNPKECKKCSENSLSTCTKCYEGEILYKGKCIEKCVPGTYLFNGKCKKCIPGCNKCHNSHSCVECDEDHVYLNGKCPVSCGKGYRLERKRCVKCHVEHCEECNTNKQVCEKCEKPRFLYNNHCHHHCPKGTFKTSHHTCETCPKHCNKCENAYSCIHCKKDYVLDGTNCVKECKSGEIEVKGKCVQCKNRNCDKCHGVEGKCIRCPLGRILFKGDCIRDCPKKYFKKNNHCHKCRKPCKECKDEHRCTSCIDKFILDGEKCKDHCKHGEHKTADNKCKKCVDKHCDKCESLASKTCIKCDKKFFLYKRECYETCPNGTMPVGEVCEPCILNCDKCTHLKKCDKCKKNFFLKFSGANCVEKCGDGYVIKGDKCVKCSTKCKACKVDNTDTCTECYRPYLLEDGDCVHRCKAGNWADIKKEKCAPCKVNHCKHCTDKGEKCIECKKDFFLQKNQCKPKCDDGYTKSLDNKKCVECGVAHCKICPPKDLKECEKCKDKFFNLQNSKCVEKCPYGTMQNEDTGKCVDCIKHCGKCSNKLKCDTCKLGYYLDCQGRCVKECKKGTRKFNGHCVKCTTKHCRNCQDNDKCKKCKRPFLLKGKECVLHCGEDQYEHNGHCKPCGRYCKKCHNHEKCIKCEHGKFLDKDRKCKDTCPERSIENDGRCIPCKTEDKCRKCHKEKLDKCIECIGKLVLKKGKCVPRCGEGYFELDRECHPCRKHCGYCNNKRSCITCKKGYYLMPLTKECVKKCGKGYRRQDGKCVECSTGCEKCNDKGCTHCEGKLYIENGKCVKSCSDDHFLDEDNKHCIKCEVPDCDKCQDKNTCKKCKYPKVLQFGKCVKKCSANYVDTKGICVQCVQKECETCEGLDNGKCIDCLPGTPLYEKKCHPKCPPKTFEKDNKCVDCIKHCKKCENTKTCIKCEGNMVLSEDKKECLHKCRPGYVRKNKECVKCVDTHCKKCRHHEDHCVECHHPKVLVKGKCREKCPPKSFYSEKDKKCKKCEIQCKTCHDKKSDCIHCEKGFYMKNGKCHPKCEKGSFEIDGKCVKCVKEHCKYCPKGVETCRKCRKPMIRRGDRCVFKCEDGEYVSDRRKCKKCKLGCHKCTHKHDCIKCEKGLVLYRNKCMKKCKDGYVEKDETCHKCHDSKCITCDRLDLKKCYKCHGEYILRTQKCVEKCKKGETMVEVSPKHKICVNCSENCELCHTKEECLKCSRGFFKRHGKCVTRCEDGEIVDSLKECRKCVPKHCLDCRGHKLEKCKRCKEGYFRYRGQCVKKCKKGMRRNHITGKCERCNIDKCHKCHSAVDKCDKCKDKHYFENGHCVHKCSQGYSPNYKNICVKCEVKNCRDCHGNKVGECKKCKKDHYLSHDGRRCVENCENDEYIFEEEKCVKCVHPCKECYNALKCKKCIEPFIFKKGKCVDKCKSGFVRVEGICVECKVKDCHKCDQIEHTICKHCKPGFYLYKNECYKKCPEHTFRRGLKCVECHKECHNCTNEKRDSCIDCKAPKVLKKHECVKECGDGWYVKLGVCHRCKNHERVKKCTEKKPIECKKGFYLDEEKEECVERCRNGYFEDEDSKKCVKCEAKDKNDCEKCKNKTECKKCRLPKVLKLGKCVEKCGGGYHLNRESECVECKNRRCYSCHRDLHKCIDCDDDWFKYDDDCVKSCPKGTYKEGKKCKKCVYPCVDCTSEKECKECKFPYIFIKKTKSCKNPCPKGYIMDEQGKCKIKCTDKDCELCCERDPSKCFKCETYLYKHRCYEKCPSGTRPNEKSKTCVECEENCKECEQGPCTECKKHYYFSEQTPKKCHHCPDDGVNMLIDNFCVKCKPEHCQSCVKGDDKKCKKCHQGYVLVDGKCQKNCKDGFYKEDDDCKPCDKNCEKCNNKDSCIKCKTNFFLSNRKCVEKCPKHTVVVKIECVKCTQSECVTCDGADTGLCHECDKEYYLYENKCHHHCPERTYPEGRRCEKCPEGCHKCDRSHCKKCNKPLKLKGNKCVPKCGEGYKETPHKCIPCEDNNCESCPVDTDKCVKCKKNTFLMKKTGKCVPDCKDGYYGDVKSNTCVECTINCKTCNDKECIVCEKGTFLHLGKCVEKCPKKMVPQSGKCVECSDKKCAKCSESNPAHCYKCEKPHVLIHRKCQDKCPLGTFMEHHKDHNECKECDNRCNECKSKKECIVCKPEFVLKAGKCVQECSKGQVMIRDKCVHCADSNCHTCLTDINHCIICEKPYILYKKSCRIQCPNGHYVSHTRECKKCDTGCESCPDSKSCHKCLNGWFLNSKKVCVKECERGYFGDCDHNICKRCNDACVECIDDSNNNCAKCHKNFFKNENSCVDKDGCRRGTYADLASGECSKCKIDFCAECKSKGICDVCVRGYERNKSGKCVEAKSFLSVIGGNPQLFSASSHKRWHARKEVKHFSSDLKGIAVQSHHVTFTFYLRVISKTSDNDKTVIFNVKDSGLSLKFEISDILKKCILNLGGTKFDLGNECTPSSLSKFAFISIAIKRIDGKAKATVVFVNSENQRRSFVFNFLVEVGKELIGRESSLEFNEIEEDQKSPSIFEISSFTVSDFEPSSEDLDKFEANKPSKCDYTCTECKNVCEKCPQFGFPQDGLCAPHFTSLSNGLAVLTSDLSIQLRKKLRHRLDSEKYGVGFWFYHNTNRDAIESILSISYGSKNIVNIFTKNAGFFVESGKTLPLKIASIIENNWYFVNVSIQEGGLTVSFRDRFERRISTPIKISGVTVLTEAAVVVLGKRFSVYDARLYLNNLPSDENINEHHLNLAVPKDCNRCDGSLTCIQCIPGKTLTNKGTCENAPEVTPEVLVEKLTISNDEIKVNVPESFKSYKEFTLETHFRRKDVDLLKSGSQTILSATREDGKSVKLIEEVNNGLFSKLFKIGGIPTAGGLSIDYSSNETDWIKFFLIFDNAGVRVVIKSKSKTKEVTIGKIENIKSFVFGDKLATRNFFEAGFVRLYPSKLKDDFFNKLESPKDCDPACLQCNYKTGDCKKCITGSQKGKTCDTYLYGFKSAFLHNVQTISKASENSFNIDLGNVFKKDVNSNKYSVLGYFRLLDSKDFTEHKDSKYVVFSLSQQNFDNYPSPSRYLIQLEINNYNGLPFYQWRVSSRTFEQNYTVKIPFTTKLWIKVLVTVDVAAKKFTYWIKGDSDNDVITKEIALSAFPGRLNEKARLSLLSIGQSPSLVSGVPPPANTFRIPSINFQYFYLAVNLAGSQNVLDKFINAFPIASDPKIKNCNLSLRDIQQGEDVCLECEAGFEKRGNICEEHKNLEYYILTDESCIKHQGKTTVEIPSKVDRNLKHTLIFFYKQNEYLTETKTILKIGEFKIDASQKSNGLGELHFSHGSSKASCHELNKNVELDYSLYAILIEFNPEKKVASIRILDENLKEIFSHTITVPKNLSNKIDLSNDSQIIILNLHIVVKVSQSIPVLPFPKVLLNSDVIAHSGDSLVCKYGRRKDNSCKSLKIVRKLLYAPVNIALGSQLQAIRHVTTSFSAYFAYSVEEPLKRLFVISNGKHKILEISASGKGFFVTAHNRKYRALHESPEGYKTGSFSGESKHDVGHVVISVIDKTISICVLKDRNDYIYNTFQLSGKIDEITTNSNILILPDNKGQVANLKFDYNYGYSHDKVKELALKKYKDPSNGCLRNGIKGCKVCFEGFRLSKGECFEHEGSQALFNKFFEINNRVQASTTVALKETNSKFSFSFFYRSIITPTGSFLKVDNITPFISASFEGENLQVKLLKSGKEIANANISGFNSDNVWYYISIGVDNSHPGKPKLVVFAQNTKAKSNKIVTSQSKESLGLTFDNNTVLKFSLTGNASTKYSYLIHKFNFHSGRCSINTSDIESRIPINTSKTISHCIRYEEGKCIKAPRIINGLENKSSKDPEQSSSKTPLYTLLRNHLGKCTETPVWDSYLIKFKANLNACLANINQLNGKVLISIHNRGDRDTDKLTLNDVIDDNSKFGVIHIDFIHNGLRLYVGSKYPTKELNSIDIFLGESFKAIRKLSFEILVVKQKVYISAKVDGLSLNYNLKLKKEAELLSSFSNIHSNPKVYKLSIQPSDPRKRDHSSYHHEKQPSNLCGKGCNSCAYSETLKANLCTSPSESHRLIGGKSIPNPSYE